MKTLITSILTFMCCVGMGQTESKDKFDSVSIMPDITNWHSFQELVIIDSIGDDDIFRYSTKDSLLFVKDSLRTIKWLIETVIGYMKKDYDSYTIPAYIYCPETSIRIKKKKLKNKKRPV